MTSKPPAFREQIMQTMSGHIDGELLHRGYYVKYLYNPDRCNCEDAEEKTRLAVDGALNSYQPPIGAVTYDPRLDLMLKWGTLYDDPWECRICRR